MANNNLASAIALGSNGGKKGGSNMWIFVVGCICCMCMSFSVGAFLIWNHDKNKKKDNFKPHNETRFY